MIDLGLPTYNENGYTAFNSSGVEKEVGELLYAYVRILKPTKVLETGTAKGISSSYIGLGLKENGKGELDTIEFDDHHWEDAENLWKSVGVSKYINLHKMKVKDFTPGDYEMMFLDSEPDQRWAELERFLPNLKEGGYVFLHDLPRGFCKGNVNPDHPEIEDWPWGKVPESIRFLLIHKQLIPFHLPNPREMTGFYKPHPGDYEI